MRTPEAKMETGKNGQYVGVMERITRQDQAIARVGDMARELAATADRRFESLERLIDRVEKNVDELLAAAMARGELDHHDLAPRVTDGNRYRAIVKRAIALIGKDPVPPTAPTLWQRITGQAAKTLAAWRERRMAWVTLMRGCGFLGDQEVRRALDASIEVSTVQNGQEKTLVRVGPGGDFCQDDPSFFADDRA